MNSHSGLEAIGIECIAKEGIVDGHKGFEEGDFTENRSRNGDVEMRRKKKRKLEGVEKENVVAGLRDEVNGDRVEIIRMKRRKKEKENNNHIGVVSVGKDIAVGFTDEWNEDSVEMVSMKKEKKKKEKEKKNNDVGDVSVDKDLAAGLIDELNEDCVEGARTKKKKKKKEKKNKDDIAVSVDIGIDSVRGTEGTACRNVDQMGGNRTENENISRREATKNKRVRFSDELEVFPDSDVPEKGKGKINEVEVVQGKRFSKEEDEIIKEAVNKFIEKHELGEEGLEMVLNCQSYQRLKGCWREIALAIPYRPYTSVYQRARKLLQGSERPWTEEEYKLLRQFHEKHGNKWAVLAKKLGRYCGHVSNAWLRTKLPNKKKGHWSQEEYKTLFDLVNADLKMRVFEEKKSRHGMLRDNISWTSISEKLATRNFHICFQIWYNQLTSAMVAEGKWSDSDDYRLVGALYDLDSSCIENVDWDNLLEHRSGEVSLQRWKQMIRQTGIHENKPFSEQVEILAQRYCPHLLEVREAWDNKPYVP